MKMDLATDKINDLLKPIIESRGFRAVRFKIFRKGSEVVLQIMIEYQNAELNLIQGDGGVNADDCAKISYAVSAALDDSDFFRGRYNLEVSSPGIDRPLITKSDFDRFIGFDIKLEFDKKHLDRKYLTGKLIANEEFYINVNSSGEIFEIDRRNIRSAKLLLTPELIKSTKNANKKFNELKKESF